MAQPYTFDLSLTLAVHVAQSSVRAVVSVVNCALSTFARARCEARSNVQFDKDSSSARGGCTWLIKSRM
jgi:hypothetical protein